MRKTFHLSTCDTCQRILKEVSSKTHCQLQDIKSTMYTDDELDTLKQLTGSYEALLNKRARKYKEQNIKEQSLSDKEYRAVILSDYTFLKRPIFVYDDNIFVGNAKKEVAAAKVFFDKL